KYIKVSRRRMDTIYIFGLGPSTLDQMPKGLYDQINQEEKIYLRTMEHPAAKELEKEGMVIESFDNL
ncbi:MAG: hypothetical protein L0L39_06730, partial [Atopostipes suicloacalis]|nr:hypothetical protein [Atopostipes suicloacalis]